MPTGSAVLQRKAVIAGDMPADIPSLTGLVLSVFVYSVGKKPKLPRKYNISDMDY